MSEAGTRSSGPTTRRSCTGSTPAECPSWTGAVVPGAAFRGAAPCHRALAVLPPASRGVDIERVTPDTLHTLPFTTKDDLRGRCTGCCPARGQASIFYETTRHHRGVQRRVPVGCGTF